MYAAIAGLKTHMQNLNVIGNNIANVNTYGYKASRAVFKTSLYTTLTGGSNGTAVMGGTNPSQIGYGANVANVDVDISSGNYAVTGVPTDLMLDGDGFFMVGTKDLALNFDGSSDDVNRLTSFTLTRVGDFQFRADGYFGKNDGNVVYGFLCTGYVTEENLSKYPGKKVGDALFSDQLVPIRYPRVQAARYYKIDPETGEYETEDVQVTNPDGTTTTETRAKIYSLPKDLNTIYDSETGKINDGFVAEGFQIAYPNTYSYNDDGTLRVDQTTGLPIESGNLHDAGYSNALEDSVLQMGQFSGISVDPNTGIISATSDDTKEVVIIGCIAIGHVTNPNGVTNIGDNYYKAGPGSGNLTICISGGNAEAMNITQINQSLQTPDENGYRTVEGLAAHSTETKVISNGLEMSKTDLAQEISMMILTQRGYQANTRIITVTDSMLEELVNMKR